MTQTKVSIAPILTEEDYHIAHDRLQEIFQAEEGTPEYAEARILGVLVDDYEQQHYPIETLDPITLIRTQMERRGMKQKDLEGIIGGKSLVSQVLNRRRALTVGMIREFEQLLGLPASLLIQEYELVAS